MRVDVPFFLACATHQTLPCSDLEGVNGLTFYLGDESEEGTQMGLVNIAAFLAQSMKGELS